MYLKNKKGIITIKALLLIVCIMLIFTCLLQSLTKRFNSNQVVRNEKMHIESALANYDTYLYTNYGLYGVEEHESIGMIKHDLIKAHVVESTFKNSLEDITVIEKAILDFMKYRLPVSALDNVLTKLEIIKKSRASQDVLDAKLLVDTLLNDFGDLEKQKQKYALKVNQIAYDEYAFYVDKLNHLINSKEPSIDRELINDLSDKFIDKVNELKEYNQQLFDLLVAISSESYQLIEVVEDTMIKVIEDEHALDVIKEAVLTELGTIKEALSNDSDQSLPQDYISYMKTNYSSVDINDYSVLYPTYKNIITLEELIKEINNCVESNSKITLENFKDYLLVEINNGEAISKEFDSYYKEQELRKDKGYLFHK